MKRLFFLSIGALLFASTAIAQTGNFNPEEDADRQCNEGTATETVVTQQTQTQAQRCTTVTTTALGIGPSGLEECLVDVDTGCTQFFRDVGCFAPNTKVLMGDKTKKEVKSLNEGEMLWNPITNKAMKISKLVMGPEKAALYQIGYGEVKVRVTEDHPMLVKKALKTVAMEDNKEALSFDVKRADAVTKDDHILGKDGKFHQVTVAKKLAVKEGQVVVNFALETDSADPREHAVLANGIVTADLTVQEAIKEKSSL